ncbi:ABC transporter ATP-binding protein [Synechococcus sp. W4D4]|uniref:ABC transporter ATP-binding protein n=1 Tax=Synechococcus sp. W4D4 TaxID=3392294 RepID=UPI0039EA270E
MTSSSPARSGLVLSQLCRRVGQQTLLQNLNLEVAPGEVLALLGPSGCGKSTTLRLIAGLDPVSGGDIELAGVTITPLPPAQRNVAMVFQSYALYPHLSVAKNLSLGLELRRVPRPMIEGELQRVLALLQLESCRDRKPAELSGGQRQRVALARALLRKPALFLLDEPMSNLDAQLREDLRGELRGLLRSTGAPVVYVTHDQHEAMGLADRIAVLKAGELQQVGSPAELYRNPQNQFVASFLGSPSINLLPLNPGELVGLRPEHLEVADASTPLSSTYAAVDAHREHLEWLGDRVISHWRVRDTRVKVLSDAQSSSAELAQESNRPLQLRWRREDELHFEQASGRRLR